MWLLVFLLPPKQVLEKNSLFQVTVLPIIYKRFNCYAGEGNIQNAKVTKVAMKQKRNKSQSKVLQKRFHTPSQINQWQSVCDSDAPSGSSNGCGSQASICLTALKF